MAYNQCLCLIVGMLALCRQAKADFVVTEGGEEGSFVGNIVDSESFPPEIGQRDLPGLQCSFLSGGNPSSQYFHIEERIGSITTAQPLDRETICGQEDTCSIKLDIAVSTNSVPVQIFRLVVNVEDINDNAPKFPEPQISMTFPEDAAVDTEMAIPTALDMDSNKNARITYYLDPTSDVFKIRHQNTLDGISGAAIVLASPLDRENKSSYELRVLAKDSGMPRQTGTLFITVDVSDENDQAPIITNPMINATLSEDSPPGTPVVTIRATDGDSGVNGHVNYRLSPRTTESVRRLFAINSSTGAITVLSSLDFEKVRHYKLIVEAFDGGAPSQSSQALVNVVVTDVNDNEPVVNVNYIFGKKNAVLSENAAVDTFVAHISVTDADFGANAIGDCLFQHTNFKIAKLRDNEFQISVDGRLDRESVSWYDMQVTCQDRGIPAMGGAGRVVVQVTDENDNAPIFSQDNFPVLVEEGLEVGKPVIHLSAHDPDKGENAATTYQIASVWPLTGVFQIDPSTGVITVAGVLDRETLPGVNLTVTATDHGHPPRRSRANVTIRVLDVNDEAPVFNKTNYDFIVQENVARGTVVGEVKALDSDLGDGGIVNYHLVERSQPSTLFTIDRDSGVIRTRQGIDRERFTVVHLPVEAIDTGSAPLSTTVTVTITVRDINDNAPEFIFPSRQNNTVYFIDVKKSSFVTRVWATDPDETGFIMYSLSGHSDTFVIDSVSGEIFLSRELNAQIDGNFSVNITANDSSVPSLTSEMKLILSLGGPASANSQTMSDSNMYVVAIVLSFTLVISLIIVGVIYFVRKRDQRRQDGPSLHTRNNAQKLTRVSFTTRGQQQITNDPIDNTDRILNNRKPAVQFSEIREPHHYDTALHRQPYHTWLTDFPLTQGPCELSVPHLGESTSNLSEQTFDSGKGGSDRSAPDGIRGDNSSHQGKSGAENLASSGEGFTKLYNGPRKGAERVGGDTLAKSVPLGETGGRQSYLTDGYPDGDGWVRGQNWEGWQRGRGYGFPDLAPSGERLGSEGDTCPGEPAISDGHIAHSVFV